MSEMYVPRNDEPARYAELARMKRMASGLLVVALVVLVTARLLESTYPWLRFVRATAEASLVGGLADWFAVTALFRRPLGLPIPHTAIIQTQKNRIGQILGTFVQNHFLSRDVLTTKLRSMRLAERIARWISDPAHGERLAGHLAAGISQIVRTIPEAEAKNFIRHSVVGRLRSVQLAPLLSEGLAAVTMEGRHQALVDEGIRLARNAIETNRDDLQQKIREESPWWLPRAIDDVLYRRLLAGADKLFDDIEVNPQHPLRIRFDTAVQEFIEGLSYSPSVIARTEALKEELLTGPILETLTAALWQRGQQVAVRLSGGDGTDGHTNHAIAEAISAIGKAMLADESRLAELNDLLADAIASVIEQHRHEAGDLITQTVRQWDAEVAAQRIELAVGRDLQFIRLNGTLVGGLAGLILYSLSLLL